MSGEETHPESLSPSSSGKKRGALRFAIVFTAIVLTLLGGYGP